MRKCRKRYKHILLKITILSNIVDKGSWLQIWYIYSILVIFSKITTYGLHHNKNKIVIRITCMRRKSETSPKVTAKSPTVRIQGWRLIHCMRLRYKSMCCFCDLKTVTVARVTLVNWNDVITYWYWTDISVMQECKWDLVKLASPGIAISKIVWWINADQCRR